MAATCNIGGSSKWRSSDTSDLEGAAVVIVPDRDEPGIKHAEVLAQEFPGALWLYPYPNSKAWENLPKSKGLDIADWIDQEKLSANEIRVAIGSGGDKRPRTFTGKCFRAIYPPQKFWLIDKIIS